MACKFLYNGQWYTEEELKQVYMAEQLSDEEQVLATVAGDSVVMYDESDLKKVLERKFKEGVTEFKTTVPAARQKDRLTTVGLNRALDEAFTRNTLIQEKKTGKLYIQASKDAGQVKGEAMLDYLEDGLDPNEFFVYSVDPVVINDNGQVVHTTGEPLFDITERTFFDNFEIVGEFNRIESPLAPIDDLNFQVSATAGSVASSEIITRVKDVIKKMGVSIEDLAEYAKRTGLDSKNVNAVADTVSRVIAVAEGKEDVALTEEMVHIATAILEQKNPGLVTEMIAKIDRFKIYKDTLEEYKTRKEYQLPDGKPNIRKIKKEAVDKLIAEVIINGDDTDNFPELMQEESVSLVESWWRAIKDWFRGQYKKANIDIFHQTADLIMNAEIGNLDGITSDGEVYLQQATNAQKSVFDKLDQTKDVIKKKYSEEPTEAILMDSEEANNFYGDERPGQNGRRVKNRVTDRVKAWYKERFPNKIFTPQEKAFNELKRKFGVAGHSDLDEIHSRFYNKDGTKKVKPDAKPLKFNVESQEMYDLLEKYYVELINQFPVGTMIRTEQVIYDPKEDEAGTIDFLAVEPDGKTHILDWKFMKMDTEQTDVAWFKQKAYDIQLKRYREILSDFYGVKEFGMRRAIPFLMKFSPIDKKDITKGYTISGIATGSANPSKIKDLRLLPVAEATESTGIPILDKMITKLNAFITQVEKERPTEQAAIEMKFKRAGALREAVRLLQVNKNIGPLVDFIEIMRKEGEDIIAKYDTTYKDKPPRSDDYKNKELSDFSDEMNDFIKRTEMFLNVEKDIGYLIYDPREPLATGDAERAAQLFRKQVYDKLINESFSIYKSREAIVAASRNFADKHIGERNLVFGLLSPEAVVKGLASLFRGVADLPLKSLQLLTKLTGEAQIRAADDSLKEVEQLMSIREKLAKRGGDLRAMVAKIYQKDEKGGFVNKLVHRFQKKFIETVNEKAEAGGDMVWLRSNIDIEGYKKEAEAELKKRIESIKKYKYAGTIEEEEEKRERDIEKEKRRFDIERPDFNGWNNYILLRHPKEKWYSEEYNVIRKDPDLSELYDFVVKFNEKAKDLGYIQNSVARTFLPFVRKSMAEELVWDGSLSVMQNVRNSLLINPDDVGLGTFNAITGELENSIPKYYTYDISYKGDGVNDYSEVSEDLFKNMILYIQQVNKYKYMTDVEGMLQLVRTVETFKGHLATNRVSEVVIKEGDKIVETGNTQNVKLYDDFLRAVLYEQKYVLSDADVPLSIGKTFNFIKDGVNKLAGREVWKKNDNPRPTSLIKTLDAANRWFQMKTLGLEIISGAANFFGSNIQVSAQAGNYFKSREFLKNEAKLTGQKFANEDDKEMFVQLINTFMPLRDDPSYEIYKQAGMSVLTRRSVSDFLFVFMRKPEILVEKSIFLSLLDNTMVVDGKLVNIREYVKAKYKDRYDSAARYREVKGKIDSEIAELKRTKSISVTKKLVDGKLEIPGLDLNNRSELNRITTLARRISANVTGNMTRESLNRMSMSIWTKSMMLFKTWIPKLADTRFGEFRKVVDDFSVRVGEDGLPEGQKYDVGRIRLLLNILGINIITGAANIRNIVVLNDAGLEKLDALLEEYRQEYKKNTGEELTITREEFIDLIRTNLRNQLKELAILLSLLAMALALGLVGPDDDDDRAQRNFHRYAQRVLDKFIGEISFFINPLEMEQTISQGSLLPALGVVGDASRFVTHFIRETTGYTLDPNKTEEQVKKEAQPIKYLMKMFPFTKSLVTWLAISDADFAKEYDVTIPKESSIR